MTGGNLAKRIKHKVIRKSDGWQPVILIGEVKFYMSSYPTKPEARRAARARASFLNQAGPL